VSWEQVTPSPSEVESSMETPLETTDVPQEHALPEDAREDSSAPEASADADLRARLMQQFEQWVDRMLAGEPPPQGLPPELLEQVQSPSSQEQLERNEESDLYTLFSALTTLSGEIRLQGRAFKQLTDALSPVPTRLQALESSQSQAADALDALRNDQALSADDLPASGKEICQLLVDLYDRLDRGVRTCDQTIASLTARRPGALARMLGGAQIIEQAAASAQAIRDASAMTLARLESALHDWGVERIGSAGEAFDPMRMTVVDARSQGDEEPGTILEVNRSGFALRGQVKQTAQVTVAKE
jgi:hypothetical protein